MDDLPPFRPIPFPNFLQAVDAFIQVPIEQLDDYQARQFWRSQEEAFLAHVRKRRHKPTGNATGIAKRWGR